MWINDQGFGDISRRFLNFSENHFDSAVSMRPRSKKNFLCHRGVRVVFIVIYGGSFLKENQTKIVYGRTYLCIYYSSTKKSSLKNWLSQAKFNLRESEAIFENTSAW